jgi:hypothetical protein
MLNNKSENFYVFPPTTVKKFAGKGSFKKIDMFNSLIESNNPDSEFIDFIGKNKGLVTTPKGIVKKPVEDIVDSIWIAKLLKNRLD